MRKPKNPLKKENQIQNKTKKKIINAPESKKEKPVDILDKKQVDFYVEEDWIEIDNLVEEYQKIFLDEESFKKKYPDEVFNKEKIKRISETAIEEIIERFYPLLKKYARIVKTGQINFSDMSERLFAALFLRDFKLKKALYGKSKITREIKESILSQFNFIKETYGHTDLDEIVVDLKMLLLILAKRYKRTNRSFCCYVSNSYRYELFRHIQKFNKNPLNIHYKKVCYDTAVKIKSPDAIDYDEMDDKIYENNRGLPDLSWIMGSSCSDTFSILTPEERKVIEKYFLEFMCDRQIAKEFGWHVNTANKKRKTAIKKLAQYLHKDKKDIKRTRNSGKKTC